MQELWRHSACEMAARLQDGSVTVHQALDCLEARIQAVDGAINALPTRCFDYARRQADRVAALPPAARGVLGGLPVAIKDLTAVKGVRTTSGSRLYAHHIPAQSDQLVEQLERQGGVVYAKSNTPEFGTGGITFNDVFGLTRNPHNTRFASGGSSGGAAAALAAGCAWLAHGSDMAGSLRTPASFCGVVSLRPSPGRVRSDSACLPFGVLGTDGPMARDLADLGLFADAMIAQPQPALRRAAETPARPARVAVSADLEVAQISDDVLAVFHRLVDSLAAAGWETVTAAPDLSGVHTAFDVLRAHEYAINLAPTLEAHPGVMKAEIEWNIRHGLELTAAQIRDAVRVQGGIVQRAAQFMREVELLICPAVSISAVPAELRYPGADGGLPIPQYYRWLAIAYATTMTALPIITLPCGHADNGMPVGVQLVGKPYGEARLFQLASAIQQHIGWNAAPIDPVAG